MKFGLMLVLLLVGQISFAETLHEKKIKEEMLTRADLMMSTVEDAREALKIEDAVLACEKLDELFKLYPEHIKDVGIHMNLFDKKTVEAKNHSLTHLMYIHQQTLICNQGDACEYLDLDKVDKQLKAIGKSLKKQRKTIQKGETDYNNTYYYEYEF